MGKEQGVRNHNRVRDGQEQSPRMRSKAGGGNTRGQTKAGLPEKERNQSRKREMCEPREQSYSSEVRESGEDRDRDRSPIRRLSGNGEFTQLLKRSVDQAVEETTTRRDEALGSCSRTQQANGEGQDGSNRKGGR